MTSRPLARWVSGVLRVGTGLSAAVIAIGVVFSAPGIALGGMFLLVLTPVAELGAATAAFASEHETRYTLIAGAACGMLLAALGLAILVSAGT